MKPAATPALRVAGLAHAFGPREVLEHIDLELPAGRTLALVGPSGSGKSTLLHLCAGLLTLREGQIDNGFTRTAMLFQQPQLLPWKTALDNIALGLKARRVGRAQRLAAARAMGQAMGLDELALAQFPPQLSGGMQSRVALARALVLEPDLLLLDEPFSNLDVELRERLGAEVRSILKEQRITTLMVTHDQQEAFALGDVVGIMREGGIVQWDTPFNLYHQPANRFVAGFIGHGVFLQGRLLSSDTVQTEIGPIQGGRSYPWPVGTPVDVLLRPDDIVPDPESGLRGRIVKEAFKGAEILYTLRLPTGADVLSLFPSHQRHQIGEQVGLRVAADHLVAFPRD